MCEQPCPALLLFGSVALRRACPAGTSRPRVLGLTHCATSFLPRSCDLVWPRPAPQLPGSVRVSLLRWRLPPLHSVRSVTLQCLPEVLDFCVLPRVCDCALHREQTDAWPCCCWKSTPAHGPSCTSDAGWSIRVEFSHQQPVVGKRRCTCDLPYPAFCSFS